MTSVPPVPSQRILLAGIGQLLSGGLSELLRRVPGLVVDVASGPEYRTDGVDVVVCGLDDVAGLAGPGRPIVLGLVPPGQDDLADVAVKLGAEGVLSIGWTSTRLVDTVLAATQARTDDDEDRTA